MNRPVVDAKPRRRFLRYSLRSLMILTVLVAVGLGYCLHLVNSYQAQRVAALAIEKLGAHYKMEPGHHQWLKWFRDGEYEDVVYLDLGRVDFSDEVAKYLAHFSHLDRLVVRGEQFTDENLLALPCRETIRWVILDTTSVSEEGVRRFEELAPEVGVHRCSAEWFDQYVQRRMLHAWGRFGTPTIVEAILGKPIDRSSTAIPSRGDDMERWSRYAFDPIVLKFGNAFPWHNDSLSAPEECKLDLAPRLPNVAIIEIWDKSFTDSHLMALRSFHQLELVILMNKTMVSPDGIRQFGAARPVVRVRPGFKPAFVELPWYSAHDASYLRDYQLDKNGRLLTEADLSNAFGRIGDIARVNVTGIVRVNVYSAGTRGASYLDGFPLADIQRDCSLAAVGFLDCTQWKENYAWKYATGTFSPGRADWNDQDLAFLRSLSQLQGLNLQLSPITDDGVELIAKLANLRLLSLKGTKITDECVPSLMKLRRLEELDLSGTQVSPRALQELASALPNCKIAPLVAIGGVTSVRPWALGESVLFPLRY